MEEIRIDGKRFQEVNDEPDPVIVHFEKMVLLMLCIIFGFALLFDLAPRYKEAQREQRERVGAPDLVIIIDGCTTVIYERLQNIQFNVDKECLNENRIPQAQGQNNGDRSPQKEKALKPKRVNR
jgi:hypothetical protein